MPHPLTPPDEPVDVDIIPHLGTYERAGARLEVRAEDAGPRMTITGPLAELVPEQSKDYSMVAVRENLYVVREPQAQTWTPVTFYTLPTGKRYLLFGVRATPKVA